MNWGRWPKAHDSHLWLLLVWIWAIPASATSFTLAATGDISLARTVAQVNSKAWNRTFSALKEVLTADAVVGNLESPLTNQPFAGPAFDLRAPLASVAALRSFTQLSVENNHALDGGVRGQEQSQAQLDRHRILPITRRVSYTQVQDQKVAWIAFLDDGQRSAPLAEVRAAARQAQLVIVLVHWGVEYGSVTERQQRLARMLAQAGANLIIGSGPHVLQGHERLGRTLVLYSLGNLLLDQPYPRTWLGAVVHLQLRAGQEIKACAVPTRYRAGGVSLATGQDAQRALESLRLPRCDLES